MWLFKSCIVSMHNIRLYLSNVNFQCYVTFHLKYSIAETKQGVPLLWHGIAVAWHCCGMAHEMAWDDIMKIYRFSFTLKNAIIIKAVKKTGEISLKTQKNQ